ncbi:MAG: flagellar biosynthesis anti-sigma factor FlgM [Candidatus Adiutrix sp.]
MKIDGLPLLNPKDKRVADNPGREPKNNNLNPSATKETGSDVVELSGRAKLVAKANELAAGAPEVRLEKISDIKTRLAAGTYDVSGRTVADAMLKKEFGTIV